MSEQEFYLKIRLLKLTFSHLGYWDDDGLLVVPKELGVLIRNISKEWPGGRKIFPKTDIGYSEAYKYLLDLMRDKDEKRFI